jgi:hypothetical protein
MQVLPFRKYEFVESFNDYYVNQQQKGFSVVTGKDFLPSFVVKLIDGVYIPSTSDFNIRIYDVFDDLVFEINSKNVIHKVYKNSTSWYYMYNGDFINCMDLSCGYYYCKINDYYSDWFKVISDFSDCIKIVAKSKFNTFELPYSLEFKQTLIIESKLLEPEIITNTISDIDSIGNENVSSVVYRKLYKLNLYSLPSNISHFLQHLESCTDITVYYLSKIVTVMKNQFKTKSTRNTSDIGTFDCEISFTEDFAEKINYCENNSIEVVSEVKFIEETECIEIVDDIFVESECIEDELTYIVTVIVT